MDETVRIAEAEKHASRIFLERKERIALAQLDFDSASDYWLEILGCVANDFYGAGNGETIAVIDTGYSSAHLEKYGVEIVEPLDLTGDGIDDHEHPHGSIVSILLALTAPRARQCPIRIFGSNPTANSDADGFRLIRKALDHAEKVGATIVNASWAILRHYTDATKHFRPDYMCSCPLCKILADFVKRTGINVFVAEGNFLHYDSTSPTGTKRKEGDWTCPAAANYVTPVFGRNGVKSAYDTNLVTTCGVTAPAEVKFPADAARFFQKTPESLGFSGSSFSTPFVSGTFASLRSGFTNRGLHGLTIPSNFETEEGFCTSYNFALDMFFVPPNEEFEDSYNEGNIESPWFLLYHYCTVTAKKLESEGDPGTAGQLCCYYADLARIAARHRRPVKSPLSFGALALDAYVRGIHYLHSSELATIADEPIENAQALLKEMEAKSENPKVLAAALAKQAEYHEAHALDFMFRL